MKYDKAMWWALYRSQCTPPEDAEEGEIAMCTYGRRYFENQGYIKFDKRASLLPAASRIGIIGGAFGYLADAIKAHSPTVHIAVIDNSQYIRNNYESEGSLAVDQWIFNDSAYFLDMEFDLIVTEDVLSTMTLREAKKLLWACDCLAPKVVHFIDINRGRWSAVEPTVWLAPANRPYPPHVIACRSMEEWEALAPGHRWIDVCEV